MLSLVPRPEHPRPQFVRPDWLNLNGEWEFEVDPSDDGLERGLAARSLAERITVPFCPEAPLSGIGRTEPMAAVWYRRRFTAPAGWAGRTVLLHFQAVDYDATVWVDGVEVARHRGGFTPFTAVLPPSERTEREIVVRARDDLESPKPRGKQTQRLENYSCFYTRTTGIWQTVWAEPVPAVHLRRPRLTPDLGGARFLVEQPVTDAPAGWSVRAAVPGVVEETVPLGASFTALIVLALPRGEARPWSPADPHLYDLQIQLLDSGGAVVDELSSYAGLRGFARRGRLLLLNGEPFFQRLVLDQGYWPEGILTAPSDAELRADIERAQAVGFNGARLHQKVVEERFLHHADRLGYLCWGEFGDWGSSTAQGVHAPAVTYAAQWLEAVERDRSHPCLAGWCPLNETGEVLGDSITDLDDATRAMWLGAKLADSSRPVLDASGYSHRVPEADVYDAHDYEQDPEVFAARHGSGAQPFANPGGEGEAWSLAYGGQPYFVSEFGGARWSPGSEGWGYGADPRSEDEFLSRFEALTGTLLGNPDMFGYCYTQLTDVYQEENGLYTFDRRPKFDAARLRAAQQRPAACEPASKD